jgi:probable HAF family extracellular repeat protein
MNFRYSSPVTHYALHLTRLPSLVTRVICALFLSLLPVVSLAGSLAVAAAPVGYSVTDLGTLGGTFSWPLAINDRGQVVGQATLPGDTAAHAFLWQNGVMTDLGTLGGPNSIASSIDDAGQIVGGADTTDPNGDYFCLSPSICHGFLWQKGVMADLGGLAGRSSLATWLNNRQRMVGASELEQLDPTGYPAYHAFVRQRGVVTDLGTLGGPNSYASAINASGQVTGEADLNWDIDPILGIPDFHAVVWQNGAVTDLGTLGGTFSESNAINDRGEVVGYSFLPGNVDIHAFLWQDGAMQDLGTVAGDSDSVAKFVSTGGQVLGGSGTLSSAVHAFLWQNGRMTDLNTLISSASGWQLQVADGINARGQIIGQGLVDGQYHGFLLTPASAADSGLASLSSSRAPAPTRPTTLTEAERSQLRNWWKSGLDRQRAL